MQEILDRYKSGILISKVTMQNAQPPEQVQAAFDDAVKAGQDRERQKTKAKPMPTMSFQRPGYGGSPARRGQWPQAAGDFHSRG